MSSLVKLFLVVSLLLTTQVFAKQPKLSASIGKKVSQAYELYQKDDLKTALTRLEALSPSADYDKAYVSRFKANLYWSLEQPKKALTALKTAYKLKALPETEQLQVQRMLADLYLNEEKFNQAIPLYTSLLAQEIKDKGLYQNLAQAYYQKKAWRKVLSPANQAIKLSKQFNKNAHLLKLTSYYQLRDYRSAVKTLALLVQVYPAEKRWWMQLASSYMQLKNNDRALATYEVAYQANFLTSENEIKTLARLRAQKGAPFQAAVLMEQSILSKKVVKSAANYKELANYWQASREHKKAELNWGLAAGFNKNNSYFMNQVRLLNLLQEYQKMLTVLNRVQSKDNNVMARVALNKTRAFFELKQYENARVNAQLAAKAPQHKQQALIWLELLESKLNDNSELASL